MKVNRLLMRLVPLAVLPALAGCLSPSHPPEVACWNIEYSAPAAPSAAEPRFGVARVSQVTVRAPYGAKSIAVLRGNGTVAFDPYNEFAAGVAQLLKGTVAEAMEKSGLFNAVVGASSSAGSDVFAEATVTRLALDCREQGRRKAVADVCVMLVSGRDIVASASGSGTADAADGNYGKAFSRAVSDALANALRGLGDGKDKKK
jgi:uncharacterized lipoprotein YmbA